MSKKLLLTVSCLLAAAVVGPAFASGQEPARTTPVAVGEMAPDFSLDSHTGEKVTLSAARGQSPVVVVFYRGYW
jgi:cytochrome oxidase Cu insertion factor (SCO1/SenC/PrrC family)